MHLEWGTSKSCIGLQEGSRRQRPRTRPTEGIKTQEITFVNTFCAMLYSEDCFTTKKVDIIVPILQQANTGIRDLMDVSLITNQPGKPFPSYILSFHLPGNT